MIMIVRRMCGLVVEGSRLMIEVIDCSLFICARDIFYYISFIAKYSISPSL